MIIYHQDNVAGFAGNHTFFWIGQQLLFSRITATSGAPPAAETGAGRPTRLVILPDGERVYLNDRQIEELRIRLSRQEPNKKQARRIKKTQPEQQVIEVPQEPNIPLPPVFSVIPVDQQTARIQAEIFEILRIEEEDTLALLLMVS